MALFIMFFRIIGTADSAVRNKVCKINEFSSHYTELRLRQDPFVCVADIPIYRNKLTPYFLLNEKLRSVQSGVKTAGASPRPTHCVFYINN